MKRIIIILLILLPAESYLLAQQPAGKAMGVRISFGQDEKTYAGGEFSFQKDVGKIGRMETDFGWWASSQWDVIKFTGIRQWKAVNKERFHIYGGIGFGAGYIMFPFKENDFFASGLIDIGVDYTFGFPIQIALDWRPEWTIINNFGTALGYEVGIAVRFAF